MTKPKNSPPELRGCAVLAPMASASARPASRGPANKPASKKTALTANRFRVVNEFVDVSMAELTGAELATWMVLWRDTKPDGTVKTSMGEVARRAGKSRRAVVDAVATLNERGLLTVVYRGGLNRGNNVYRVHGIGMPPGVA